MQSENFIVSHFDLLRQLDGKILFAFMLLLQLQDFMVVGLASFVGLSYLVCQLALVSEVVLLDLEA